MPTVRIDWDDTLVGYRKYGVEGEWLPGSLELLRKLRNAKLGIVIHSCRVNYPQGYEQIKAKLAASGFRESSKLKIHLAPGKPLGVLYIDDRGMRFEGGEWTKEKINLALRLAEHGINSWTP